MNHFLKKFFSSLIIMLCLWTNCLALDPVGLSVGYDNPLPSAPGHGKGPVQTPSLWQESHSLQFDAGHADFTLTLLDASGAVVYATYVPTVLTTLTLPATLTGTYELRLQESGSSYYYYGYINL